MTDRTTKNNQNPTKLKDTLGEFLFNQIENDPDYQDWLKTFELPLEISKNLKYPLRPYQEQAVKAFIYLYENHGMQTAKHLLFNMATGTGKTLTMAAIVLYLHEQGYSNFVFLVHQLQIKDQAIKNFTDPSFEKYLFAKSVKFGGKAIKIKEVTRFDDANSDNINFMFCSTSMLYTRLTVPKENSITLADFENNRTVIIADEAHRLNVDTKKNRTKTEDEEVKNWETAVQSALSANPKNMLLEFTATVDLENKAIFDKYKDKLITRYDFLQFNKDGYSKNVGFLYNEETHIADQKRLLIVNAVALSEYRKLYFKQEMGEDFSPIVLIKSTKIAQSVEDRAFFHKVIQSLDLQDFAHLQAIGKNEQLRLDGQDKHSLIANMFVWIKNNLGTPNDTTGLLAFISEIKLHFAEHHTMIYNSKEKQNADKLLQLDTPHNTIRAIFSVNALNEGWDVLGLYDIIHFDISANKKVSLQDIQLIGRGARLKPYNLPKSYKQDDNLFADSDGFFEFDKYRRKFDHAPNNNGRILETFYYHFVKTGTFLNQLQESLLDEGIINQGMKKHTIRLKDEFMQSDTYKNGFVLINEQEYRKRTTEDEVQKTFTGTIKASHYKLHARTLTDKENNKKLVNSRTMAIKLSEAFFSRAMLQKALVMAENNFFRFNNLTRHIVDLNSIDDLIDTYLPMYDIEYHYSDDKNIHSLTAHEKLQLLVSGILPEVRKAIDRYMPVVTGSQIFRPKSLAEIFKQEKNIYLVAYPTANGETVIDERGKAQSTHSDDDLRYDVQNADWYAYTENYGTSEEKYFVKFIAHHIEALKQQFSNAQIYLIRNELDYYLFSPEDGRRFAPDYLMIINDNDNKQWYYQCLFEPKGSHLIEHDKWKEQILINLDKDSQIVLNTDSDSDYQEIKCLGFKFFNSDSQNRTDFSTDFQQKLLS